MKKKIIFSAKIMWHIVATMFLLALIGAGVLAWRLSQGPINMDFALPYIENALNTQSTDMHFDIDSLYLDWGQNHNLIELKAGKVVISNRRGPFMYTPEVNINLSIPYLMVGQIKMEDVWIPRISLSLTRHRDGRIQITGSGMRDREVVEEVEHGVPAVVTVHNLLYDLPVLNRFRIDEARITYRDRINDTTKIFDPVSAFVDLDISVTGERSMEGYLTLPFGDEKQGNMRVDFATQNNPLSIAVTANIADTELSHLLQFTSGLPDGWGVDMTTTADIGIIMDNLWTVTSFTFNGQSEEGTVTFPLPDGRNETMRVTSMAASVTKDETGNALQIDKLTAIIDDTATLSVTGLLQHPTNPDRMAGDIDLSISHLPQEWFGRFWPKPEGRLLVREWLVDRISHGTYKDLTGNIIFDMAAPEGFREGRVLPNWLTTVVVDFAYEDMRVDYNKPMTQAAKVNGKGQYKDIGLSLDVKSADVGGLIVTDATLHFDDLISNDNGTAIFHFPITGPLSSVFDYIAKDPINALDKVDLNVKQTKGQATLTADVTFPLSGDMETDDIKVEVKGVVSDLEMQDAMRGLTLSGGPYDIAVTTDEIKFSGSGFIQGQPIRLDWHEYLNIPNDAKYATKIDAKLTANDAVRRAFMGGQADYFAGLVGTELLYQKNKNGKDAVVTLDLDLQSTSVTMDDVGLLKKHGDAAKASLTLNLNNGNLRSIEKLNVTGTGISIVNARANFKTIGGEQALHNADFPVVKFGDNDLTLSVGETDEHRKITISGRSLDARPILKSEKQDDKTGVKSAGQAYEIGIDVDEMRTSDKAGIKNVKVYAKAGTNARIQQFELDAVAGNGKLYVRYKPETDANLSLRVEAEDAGATLRAFDLYPNIVGGQLRIAGRPLPGGRLGDVKGKARINNFKVWNAPVLVRLGNALSLPGIIGLLEQQQLGFERLDADFEWRLGPKGHLYLIENGTTSGASLGLTFEGSVDTSINEMTIRGTAAPLSSVDKVIGRIPVIGQILTGGENGAVVAATYVMSGKTDDPQVSVNPLSMLTPGILRRMLFENTSAQPSAE